MRIVWKTFLALYFVALCIHLFETGFSSPWQVGILLAGFLLALIAHKKSSVLSLLFLLTHMTIEAIEFSAHGPHTTGLLIGFGIHALMDVIFLFGEIKRHFPKATVPLFLSTTVLLASVYTFLPRYIKVFTDHADHESGILYFVIGGVLGCAISHLVPHRDHDHV